MLPQAHRSGTRMALVLVQYIDDPERVYREVRQQFARVPTVGAIARMRQDYLRPGPPPLSFKREIDAYAASMERSNRAFLRALHIERATLTSNRSTF